MNYNEYLRLCDRRIPFLHRLWLAEMDGCSMAVVTQIKDLDNCSITEDLRLKNGGKNASGIGSVFEYSDTSEECRV